MIGRLSPAQRGVAGGMAIGIVATAAALALAAAAGRPAPLADRVDGLVLAVAMLGGWVAVAIAQVARLRFASTVAIDGGGGDERVDRASAVLRNTLEQAVLAAFAYAALAWRAERSLLLLACLAMLFSIGRVLFWAGYAHGAPARAAGFALTFYPSVAALLIVPFC